MLVAEDSSTARRLLVEVLRGDPAFEVVGEASNGAEAIERAVALAPDLITMDVHMPLVDGLDATKAIMREVPTPILIVSAAAVPGDVELSLSATQAGALMVVEKPCDPSSEQFEQQRAQLLAMARAMAEVKVVRRWGGSTGARGDGGSSVAGRSRAERPATRARGGGTIDLVAIGTSTGGPAALHRIFIDLPRDFPVPILVVQHIARGFVSGLASWLGANCSLSVTVAADGEPLVPGTVYLAPDGRHLGVTVDRRVRLSDAAPVGGFRPSADHLFESCARVMGRSVAAVVLTGMGRDGVEGLRAVHAAGGRVLAQDETSSVVYGMAQEAVQAGVVDELLPLEALPRRLVELAS
ncbi:MAG TPA: chemotaxis-specific protein-glutamate methyltransferase CheB [Gemmatimonadaceae bacterium]